MMMSFTRAFSRVSLPRLPFKSRPGGDEIYLTGHRKRLRDRLVGGDADALSDEDLLQIVLSSAVPTKNMSELAFRLVAQFGDYNRVISAPGPQLLKIPGVGPAILAQFRLIEASARRLSRGKILGETILTSWDSLLDYCHTVVGHRKIEHFRLLFLDAQNRLIADEEQNVGTVNHVPVYPREVVKRALELNASAIILVHNHPSGDPTPSDADIRMTQQIIDALETVSISVHDHLIIGKSCELSFRAEGLL